jgi:hypothetical protein
MDRLKRFACFAVVALFPGTACLAQETCRTRVEIRIDAEVPDARDPSFLSALLANPQYRLAWVSGDDDTQVYDLTGPGGDEGCSRMLEQIRRSAAVLDLKVLELEPARD